MDKLPEELRERGKQYIKDIDDKFEKESKSQLAVMMETMSVEKDDPTPMMVLVEDNGDLNIIGLLGDMGQSAEQRADKMQWLAKDIGKRGLHVVTMYFGCFAWCATYSHEELEEMKLSCEEVPQPSSSDRRVEILGFSGSTMAGKVCHAVVPTRRENESLPTNFPPIDEVDISFCHRKDSHDQLLSAFWVGFTEGFKERIGLE